VQPAIIDATLGALPCIWNRISTKMSSLRGFAIHSKVEQTFEKPAFGRTKEGGRQA